MSLAYWQVTCNDLIGSLCFAIPRVLAGLLAGTRCFGLQSFQLRKLVLRDFDQSWLVSSF